MSTLSQERKTDLILKSLAIVTKNTWKGAENEFAAGSHATTAT